MLIPQRPNTFKQDDEDFVYNSAQARNAQPQTAPVVTPQATAPEQAPSQLEQNFDASFSAGQEGRDATAARYSESEDVTRQRARDAVNQNAQRQYDDYMSSQWAQVQGTPQAAMGDWAGQLNDNWQRMTREAGWNLGGRLAAEQEAARRRDAYQSNFNDYFNRMRQSVLVPGTEAVAGRNATATFTPFQEQAWAPGKSGASIARGATQTVTGTPTGTFSGLSSAQQSALNRMRGT